MDNARNVAQNRQQDVDEQVGTAAALEEDAERGQDDGEDDLDDVAVMGGGVSRRIWDGVCCSPRGCGRVALNGRQVVQQQAGAEEVRLTIR